LLKVVLRGLQNISLNLQMWLDKIIVTMQSVRILNQLRLRKSHPWVPDICVSRWLGSRSDETALMPAPCKRAANRRTPAWCSKGSGRLLQQKQNH